MLYADLDYPGMQYAMNWLADRRGVRVAQVAMPEPATQRSCSTPTRAALDANPDVRVMLVTHCSHKTGLIFPVPELVALARARGVDVLVDAAQSWGQVELDVTAWAPTSSASRCRSGLPVPSASAPSTSAKRGWATSTA